MIRIGVETSVTVFNNAGTGRYSSQLISALQSQRPKDIEFFEVKASQFVRVPKPGLSRKIFVAYWEFIYCTLLLPLQVRQLDLDLLHCTSPLPLPAMKNVNTKVVTTILDVIPYSHPHWFSPIMRLRLQRWIRRSVTHSNHFIAISHFTKQSLRERLGVPESKITVTYLGKQIPGVVKPIMPGQFLLTVGTIEPRKNLITVLEAYSLLKQQLYSVPKLYIVGGKGWGDTKLTETIQRLNVTGEVELLGFVSDEALFQLYREAQMLIYPSLQEGFGMPPLEAMASGCPVITSNVSSLPEVVGEAGIMVDPYDTSALADAMATILCDDSLAQDLRRRGQQRARQFTWQRCVQETLSVYRKVLSQ